MTSRQPPPGRTSMSRLVVVKPRGPHQRTICFGSVHAPKTRSRGASKTRVTTSSRSAGSAISSFFAGTFTLLCLNLFQVLIQAIEAFFPEAAVLLDPIGGALE